MEISDFRPLAERTTLPRLIEILDPRASRIWNVNEAVIEAIKIHNRFGVQDPAVTYKYRINYLPASWSVVVRSVRVGNDLLRPWGTHTIVEEYHDNDGIHGGSWEVQRYFLEWLQGIPGL